MLIQRSPSASTTSTFGVSGSTTCAMPSVRERAARRRGGRGSLGMATEGLVDGRDHGEAQSTGRASGFRRKQGACSLESGCYGSGDIAVHVQRGGGTGPMKPRQPPLRREGANSWRRVAREDTSSSHDGTGEEQGSPR